MESLEMFIFSCIDIAPYRRVFRKLCLLLPMLLVKMPAKYRMYFGCKSFLFGATEWTTKHSVLKGLSAANYLSIPAGKSFIDTQCIDFQSITLFLRRILQLCM